MSLNVFLILIFLVNNDTGYLLEVVVDFIGIYLAPINSEK